MIEWNSTTRRGGLVLILLGFCVGQCNLSQAALKQYSQISTDLVGDPHSIDPQSPALLPTALNLTFALNGASPEVIDHYVASQYDPLSPTFHKWLTPSQFGQKFGASETDIACVKNYLQQNGFTDITVWRNRSFVSARTSPSHAEALFGVHLNSYLRVLSDTENGYSRSYYSPDREPALDSSVASRLSGVFGLSSAASHAPKFIKPMSQASNSALNPSGLADLYNGAALRAAGNTGSGITIGIFSPTTYPTSDVNAFLSSNSISAAKISVVNVNGGTRDAANAEEATIDIETVVGQASGATIHVYEGPNDGSLDIFNQMADDDPEIVTESYGADENSVSQSFATSYETLRKQMASEGISIIVASGDNGAYDSNYQSSVTVSVDASSAYVTSIGGTELSPFSNNIWNGEIAWSYNDNTLGPNSGSGGGLSIYYPAPSWQVGPGVVNSASNGMRQLPDISSLASTPFYNIYYQGSFSAYGGTSCACQFFGGTLALIEQQVGTKLGNINPSLYSFGQLNSPIYHDIISGNNGVYSCTPGWDYVTGWGSPDFAKLALAFEGTNTQSTAVHSFSPGLQMFSIPFTFPSGDTFSELISGLVSPAGVPAYSVAAWNTTTSLYALSPNSPAATPLPGQGYWGRFGNNTSIASLTAVGVPVTSASVTVPLTAGWNLIGNPYLSAVPINALSISTLSGTTSFSDAVSSNIVQSTFYDYNGSNYIAHTMGDTIEPYDGYWIYALSNCSLIFTSP